LRLQTFCILLGVGFARAEAMDFLRRIGTRRGEVVCAIILHKSLFVSELQSLVMNYIQVTIEVREGGLREILIARLSEMGYEGFEEEARLLHAFIPEENFDAVLLGSLLCGWDLAHGQILIPKKNWNEEWETNFHPVIVGGFCAVRASFHPPVGGVAHEIVITPKMSFGTGHHATTFMMMEAMQHLDFTGSNVLDFGTGTGVLAILAERLGAGGVLAIDHDDWSIENALENVTENHCRAVVVEKMETIPSNGLFSIVLANINKNVILQELDAIRQHLTDEGVILLSGLLQDDLAEIEQKAISNDLTISLHGRMTKGNWICLKLERCNK
jgi:ribosomal protein L11 methyltransferase